FKDLKECILRAETLGITFDEVKRIRFWPNKSSIQDNDIDMNDIPVISSLTEIKVLLIDSIMNCNFIPIQKFIEGNPSIEKLILKDDFSIYAYDLNKTMCQTLNSLLKTRVRSLEFIECEFLKVPEIKRESLSWVQSIKIKNCKNLREFPTELIRKDVSS